MKDNQELIDLTNKFLEEFFTLASKEDGKRDDLFHFNFTLAKVIGQSNYPKYKESTTLLMGMSSFDDSIAKAFMQNRVQGFIASVEKRIQIIEQEDYLVLDIVTKSTKKEKDTFDWDYEDGKMVNFKVGKEEIDAEEISFKVVNTRSCFEGSVIIYREIDREFSSDNDFVDKMMTKEIAFFNKKGERIMIVSYNDIFDLRKKTLEKVEFTHYKHIADINSFFFILEGY